MGSKEEESFHSYHEYVRGAHVKQHILSIYKDVFKFLLNRIMLPNPVAWFLPAKYPWHLTFWWINNLPASCCIPKIFRSNSNNNKNTIFLQCLHGKVNFACGEKLPRALSLSSAAPLLLSCWSSLSLCLSLSHFFHSVAGHVAWQGAMRRRGEGTLCLSAPSGVAYEWLSMKYLCKQPLKSPERLKQTARIIIHGQLGQLCWTRATTGASPVKGFGKLQRRHAPSH